MLWVRLAEVFAHFDQPLYSSGCWKPFLHPATERLAKYADDNQNHDERQQLP
jgi:hypothetical protein